MFMQGMSFSAVNVLPGSVWASQIYSDSTSSSDSGHVVGVSKWGIPAILQIPPVARIQNIATS